MAYPTALLPRNYMKDKQQNIPVQKPPDSGGEVPKPNWR
jgi:hypothetical protein